MKPSPRKKQRLLRRVKFLPYGFLGTDFTLWLWSTGEKSNDNPQREIIAYRLERNDVTFFVGDEYYPSAFMLPHGADSIEGLMGFLTLKPGDTDDEHFAKYTKRQLRFCREEAEDLMLAVRDWYPGEYARVDEKELPFHRVQLNRSPA